MIKKSLFVAVCAFLMLLAGLARGGEPEWTTRVIKRGEDRRVTNSTDIVLRPYRPLHFYGNTVRRQHYRGVARPTAKDLAATLRNLARP